VRNYFNFLIKSEFNKNVYTLFKGILIAQVFGVIGNLFLAKYYGETSYGFYSIILSNTGIFTVLLTFNFEQTIILTKSEKQRTTIINGLFTFALAVSIILLTLITFLNLSIDSYVPNIYQLVILCGFIMAIKNILEMYYNQKSAYKIISNSKIWLIVLTIGIQFLLLDYHDTLGLAIGFLIANFLIVIFYLYNSNLLFKIPEKKSVIELFKTYKKILYYGFSSNLINSIANNILPILIAFFFTVSETGVFALSIKVVLTPMLLISSSISPVFFQQGNEIYKTDKSLFYPFLKKVVFQNLIVIGIIIILINIIGVPLLNFFFKNEFENLNFYIAIISFYVIARSCYNPISYISTIVNKLQVELYLNLYLITINIAAIYIGYYYQNLLITVGLFSVFSGMGYVFSLLYFLKTIRT